MSSRVAGRTAAYATFADGHDSMLVLDAVADSARHDRWVDVARAGTLEEAAR